MNDARPRVDHGRPLRILIGCDTFAPDINGAARFSERLAAGLVGRGHEVVVVAPSDTGRQALRTESHEGASFPVYRLRSWRWWPHPWLRYALPWRSNANAVRVLDEVRPDVVHFQSHIVVGRGLARESLRRGIRLVGTNHIMPDNAIHHVQIFPRPVLRWLVAVQWRSAAKWFGPADAVTTPTQRAAEFFEHNTGLRGVLAVSCGIDASKYTPAPARGGTNLIAFVGRLEEEKHVDELLRALALLDPRLDARLEIVGEGEQRAKLEALARELGIRDRVRFLGAVSDAEMRALLTRATVFAMPSRAELQSIATLEAMASGLPVVAADAMALPHLVEPGVNGYLVTPGDVDEFAARLTDVLTAPETEYERLRRGSLRMIEGHDIERTIDTFECLYRGEPVANLVTDVTLDAADTPRGPGDAGR